MDVFAERRTANTAIHLLVVPVETVFIQRTETNAGKGCLSISYQYYFVTFLAICT
jgi:hypothetical protein